MEESFNPFADLVENESNLNDNVISSLNKAPKLEEKKREKNKNKSKIKGDESNEKKDRKRKQMESESEDEESEDEKDSEEKSEKRERRKKKKKINLTAEEQEEVDRRTVFVGNVSLETKEKDVKTIFKKHGSIKTIRFRSVPFSIGGDRKVNYLRKQFHTERKTCNVYIVFKEEESAKKALAENGTILGGNTLRVDSVMKPAIETESTLFVGNLPFNVEEEDIRDHFSSCGDIKYIRCIRDKLTNIGVGISFVCFQEKKSVVEALKKKNETFQGRHLRIKKYSKSEHAKSTSKKKGEQKKETEKSKVAASTKKGKIPSWMGKIVVKEGQEFEAVAKEKQFTPGSKKKKRTPGGRNFERKKASKKNTKK